MLMSSHWNVTDMLIFKICSHCSGGKNDLALVWKSDIG
jgi:hypothetical protein